MAVISAPGSFNPNIDLDKVAVVQPSFLARWETLSMPQFLITWLITAVSLLITAHFIPGFELKGVEAAAIAAVIVGLVNAIVRPILFWLTLPITILTLGLFTFVLNAITIWIASGLTPGFRIDGFIPALIGSLVLSIVSGLLNAIFDRSA
jgi:putative membrane protein